MGQQTWEQSYQLATAAVEQQQWREAECLLRPLLVVQPHHATAHHLLGRCLKAQGQLQEALTAQQRSCQLDPGMGWNWFAAGELLMEHRRWQEAADAFAWARQALPAEDWIAQQWQQARAAMAFGAAPTSGEQGLGARAYQHWIQHHEPRLPDPLTAFKQSFWLLDQNGGFRALHGPATLQPRPMPLGASPWPADGWLVLLGAKARLRPGSLQALEEWLEEQDSAVDLVYADEDRVSPEGRRERPWFKPGWVPESFWSSPWLHHFSAWRLRWLAAHQLPLPAGTASERFRWTLTALSHQPTIGHCPSVLTHVLADAPAPDSAEHTAAQQDQAHALLHHLQQQGERMERVTPHPQLQGCFQLQWTPPQATRCCLIIPTRDRADLLGQCLKSVWATTAAERARGVDLEIIVVDNGSQEPATAQLLAHWQQQLQARFRVLRSDEPFNWSRLNNQAATATQAELVLLLNNDIEADREGWLDAMVRQALRPQVGCVGANLLYPDGTLQHGGIVVAMHGGADHAYRGLALNHGVHGGRSRLLTGWGAVTGACLMLRRALLVRCGGLDEGLPVEFNDVDLGLSLHALGLRNVIPPEAVLIHHESQTRDARGSRTAAAAMTRMRLRWAGQLAHTAPWWPAQSDDTQPDGRPEGMEYLPV